MYGSKECMCKFLESVSDGKEAEPLSWSKMTIALLLLHIYMYGMLPLLNCFSLFQLALLLGSMYNIILLQSVSAGTVTFARLDVKLVVHKSAKNTFTQCYHAIGCRDSDCRCVDMQKV